MFLPYSLAMQSAAIGFDLWLLWTFGIVTA